MKVLLGTKIGMTRTFHENGQVVPVTLIAAGPCTVVWVDADRRRVQMGFGKAKTLSRPRAGQLKDLPPHAVLREVTVPPHTDLPKRGDTLTVETFTEGDLIIVRGTSKGKGFAGVVKRHGFHGGPASHGHRHVLRSPGSIGSQYPQRVWPGKKMAGRMGFSRVTVKGLRVVATDPKRNLLAVSGAIPGRRGTLIHIEEDAQRVTAAKDKKASEKKT